MFQKRNILSLAVVLAFPVLAQATVPANDADVDENDVIELEDTYVTPDYVEIDRLRETKEVIVITKDQIQKKGRRTVSDVLDTVPSINVGNTGMGHIDIRGQGAGQDTRNLQVLLDGAPITTLIDHPLNTDYDVIPVEQLERIEVVPGGGSVLYGSGASGGIINITSNLRGMKDPKSAINAEYNQKGYRLSGNLGGRFADDRFSYDLSASRLERDLYFKNTYRDSNYYSAGLRWDLTKDQHAILRVSHLDESSQFIGNVNIRKVEAQGENYHPGYRDEVIGLDKDGHKIKKRVEDYLNGDRDMTTVNFSYFNHLNDSLDLSVDTFYNEGFFTGIDNENKQMDNEGYGVKTKIDWKYLGNNNLLIGFDYTKQNASFEYMSYKYLKPGTYSELPLHYHYDKQVSALYALNTLRYNDFVFTQGVRRELTRWAFDKNDTGKQSGADVDNRWNTAAELSAAYNYRDTGKIYARYERGYTVPDGMQITDSLPMPDGTKLMSVTEAEDEEFDMYEIGLTDKIGFTTVSLTAWMSETDNQMNRFLYFTDDGFTRKTMNLLETRRWGVDVALSQDFGNLRFSESYSYLKGRTRPNGAEAREFFDKYELSMDYSGSGLACVPKHKINVSAEWDPFEFLTLKADYTHFGSYNNFMYNHENEGDAKLKDYGILDLTFNWTPLRDLEVYGGITNVLDEDYWEYQSSGNASPWSSVIPGVGRAAFIGMKATF